MIETPTPAQRIIYGDERRRIPLLWDVDNPVMAGLVQNQDSYMQSVAAQRPFFFDHVSELTDRAFREFHELTGRSYQRVMTYRADDADYLIVGQGSLIPTAEAVADHLRETRGIKVGVVDFVMFRPFPADLIGRIMKGKKGVSVLERLDQPLAIDLPLMREIRATIGKCLENGKQVPGERQGPREPGPPGARDLSGARGRTGALLRILRHGQPRPAARGHRGRGGEHAARRKAQAALLPVHRFPA
jgi:pyruvate-ferredoxin/flavodoxin oxidoreductase